MKHDHVFIVNYSTLNQSYRMLGHFKYVDSCVLYSPINICFNFVRVRKKKEMKVT